MGIYKTWIAGTDTLVITIPKDEKTAKGIKEGDYLEIPTIKKITPKQKIQEEEPETIKETRIKAIFK